MPKGLAAGALGGDVWKRLDGYLHAVPKAYMACIIVALQTLSLHQYSVVGPWVPMTVFFLFGLFLAVKYVGGGFAYALAVTTAAAKTYVKVGFFPSDVEWWQGQWQFVSSVSIYLFFCYLMHAQLQRSRRVETVLDNLSALNDAIISSAESGIMVFSAQGRSIIVNDAAVQILGQPLASLQQLDYLQDVAATPAADWLLAGRETMRSGGELKFTAKLRVQDGKDVWCVIAMRQIKCAETVYLLVMFTDISAYQTAMLAKQRADKQAAVALAKAGVAERKMLRISEETQQRIGRELHDDLGQFLTGMACISEVLNRKLSEAQREERHDAAKLAELANQTMVRTRNLAHGLYPAELREQGLVKMMERFADYVESVYQLDCEFYAQPGLAVDDKEVAINLFRIAQEAVTNALKHGKAQRIEMSLTAPASESLRLTIWDDGVGIASDADQSAGLGIRSMSYRAELLGARLHIAPRKSGGTEVVLSMHDE